MNIRKKINNFVMSKDFQDRRGPINEIDYIDDIIEMLYETCQACGLDVGFDQCDNGSDCWIQSTVYVPNMIGNSGYYVILDCDVKKYFDTYEEFVDTVYQQEAHAQKVKSFFTS